VSTAGSFFGFFPIVRYDRTADRRSVIVDRREMPPTDLNEREFVVGGIRFGCEAQIALLSQAFETLEGFRFESEFTAGAAKVGELLFERDGFNATLIGGRQAVLQEGTR